MIIILSLILPEMLGLRIRTHSENDTEKSMQSRRGKYMSDGKIHKNIVF